MRKRLHALVAIMVIVCFAYGTAWAGKAGGIKDDVYTDSGFNFSFKIPAGWSASIKDAKSALRISMNQKSYPVPEQFKAHPDYAQIPTITVLADTTSLTVDQFLDNLLDGKAKSKQKDFFLRNLALISKPHEVLKRSDATVAGAKAIQLDVRQQYSLEVAKPMDPDDEAAGTDRADVVNDFKAGIIFVTVRDGKVLVIHGICEYKLSAQYKDSFGVLFNSLALK